MHLSSEEGNSSGFGRVLARGAAGLAVAAGAIVLATPAHAEGEPPAPVVLDAPAPVLTAPPEPDADQAELMAAIATERARALAEAVESIPEQPAAVPPPVHVPVISPPIGPSAKQAAPVGEKTVWHGGSTTSQGQYHASSRQYHRPGRATAAPGGQALTRPSAHSSVEHAIQRMKQLRKAARICPRNLATNDSGIVLRIAYCPGDGGSTEPQADPAPESSPSSAVPSAGETCGRGDTADSQGDIACGGEPARGTSFSASPESGVPSLVTAHVQRHSAARPSRPAARGARAGRASSRPDRRAPAILPAAARSSAADESIRRPLLMLAGLALLALLLALASTASNAGAGLVGIRSRVGSKGLSSGRIDLGQTRRRGSRGGSTEIRYRE